ncbi:metal ABC transporter ATP-binding protein [Patescibacteria group bacterium]|nr:metal ABC transporter ATP-binding protein [Patescibacteria group bacterium]MCL5797229.1 metal ABC transporter ATP-binding protein [Patescibacteria group bacterium]
MSQVDHTKNIIELKNISFSYGNELVVKDVNLEVHKGDYLGIIGVNGGGKSTLLKLMLGLLTPTKGHIYLYDKGIKQFHDWSKIGYISQQAAHIDPSFPMTVAEVVQMGRYPKLGLFHFPGKKDKEIVRRALDDVEMWRFKDRLVGDLSGGQQQRVFIARALAGEPEVIILDEPTVGVDVATQKQFYSLLQRLNRENNLTLILVSHELDVVAHEATEIAYINRSLIYWGLPGKFMKSQYFTTLFGEKRHAKHI